jgi:hypothetical protein
MRRWVNDLGLLCYDSSDAARSRSALSLETSAIARPTKLSCTILARRFWRLLVIFSFGATALLFERLTEVMRFRNQHDQLRLVIQKALPAAGAPGIPGSAVVSLDALASVDAALQSFQGVDVLDVSPDATGWAYARTVCRAFCCAVVVSGSCCDCVAHSRMKA